MEGLVYLLNQSGIALAQATAEVEALRAEVQRLSALGTGEPKAKE